MSDDTSDVGEGVFLERRYLRCNPLLGHYGPGVPRPKSTLIPRLWNPPKEDEDERMDGEQQVEARDSD